MPNTKNTYPENLAESLKVISNFLNNFSPEEIKKISWELLIYALGSEDTDGLSHHERSNMLFFYEQINKVCEALVVIHSNHTNGGLN